MRAQTLFLNEFDFNTQARGENLIVPLLLVILTFGVFLMSSNSSDKFDSTLKPNLTNKISSERIASGSQSDTKKNIIDIIWACPVQSLLDGGQGCGAN